MTPESIEIATEMDGYPEWARKKMRDSFMRLADAYAATGARLVERTPEKSSGVATQPADVISLAARRARHA